mgnify:FL=1
MSGSVRLVGVEEEHGVDAAWKNRTERRIASPSGQEVETSLPAGAESLASPAYSSVPRRLPSQEVGTGLRTRVEASRSGAPCQSRAPPVQRRVNRVPPARGAPCPTPEWRAIRPPPSPVRLSPHVHEKGPPNRQASFRYGSRRPPTSSRACLAVPTLGQRGEKTGPTERHRPGQQIL